MTDASRTQQLVLENGLQAAWQEDHRQPIVAIEARIKGGIRGEGPYVGSGITHFIEHMLFKGTPTRPPGSIEQEVRSYGGSINAFTSFDSTGISLYVDAASLRPALELVADVLRNAQFPPEEFQKEREVIISEIRMNLDDPERRLSRLFWSRHLLEHPYRHPILGYRSRLEGLTLEDLQRFYASQYQPQRVSVSCVGDVDGGAMEALILDVFGGWTRGQSEIRHDLVPEEPPPAAPRSETLRMPVQSAYVMLGFPSTRLSDPDTYPLDVLAAIVGHGASSRLYETVVRKQQLADAVGAWNYTPYDPGIFGVSFRTRTDRVDAALASIREIFDAVLSGGVTEEELKKAKRQTVASYVFGLQTVTARAGDLASSMLQTGDPEFSRRYLERIEAVTADQVRDAAARYLDSSRMTVASIMPEEASAESRDAEPAQEEFSVERHVLGNGLVALIGVDRHVPIAAIVASFRGGVRAETDTTQGLSNLVATMLTKGTSAKDAEAIALQVESMGGGLESFSGRDGFGVALRLLSEDLGGGIALVHELLSDASMAPEELELQRQLLLQRLQAEEDDIFHVGSRRLRETVFRGHPYRFRASGTPETVRDLSRRECLEFARKRLTPDNGVIAVFGDLDPHAVLEQLEATFGSLRGTGAEWPERLRAEFPDSIRRESVPMDREQALILLGFPGSRRTAQDRYALDLVTAVLSGMAGRLFQSVREAHGLSYTLGAYHVPGWDPGDLVVYAATKPEERARVQALLEEQLTRVAEQGFTDEELEQAKRYLIGAHRSELQDLVGLTKRSAIDELYGVGYDGWTRYEQEIRGTTLEALNRTAREHLAIERRAEVIVIPDGSAGGR
ncbi:MAG TPA: pitrilysin family protein [bacterium]